MATAWPDALGEAGPVQTWLNHAAFMCATFAWHAALGMIAPLVAAAILRRWQLLAAATAAMLLCGGAEGWLALVRTRPEAAPGATLSVMSANVLFGRSDGEAFMAEVAAHGPDVIVFQEWTARARLEIGSRLEAEYPHRTEALRPHGAGQAVYSRRPFAAPARVDSPSPSAEPQITVAVLHEGREVRIRNVHAPPPVSPHHRAEQRRMTRLLAAAAGAGDPTRPHVLAGDFNAVSRSANIRLLRRAGMIEAHREAGELGRGSTWPRLGRLRSVPGIRIDHILYESTLVCVSSAVCRDVGSDHAPIVATLAWRDAAVSSAPRAAAGQR